jgi:hypothetical protein
MIALQGPLYTSSECYTKRAHAFEIKLGRLRLSEVSFKPRYGYSRYAEVLDLSGVVHFHLAKVDKVADWVSARHEHSFDSFGNSSPLQCCANGRSRVTSTCSSSEQRAAVKRRA